jgi:hypothetical protein
MLILNGCFLLVFRANVQDAPKYSILQELSKLGLLPKAVYLRQINSFYRHNTSNCFCLLLLGAKLSVLYRLRFL